MEEVPVRQFKIVAGLPMYNEEETIGTVVTKVLDYVDEIVGLKAIQKQMFGFVDSSFADDIKYGRAKSGYLRVCASWLRTLW